MSALDPAKTRQEAADAAYALKLKVPPLNPAFPYRTLILPFDEFRLIEDPDPFPDDKSKSP